MGLGIWSMHFVGMMAFNLPIMVKYDGLLTLISLVVAITASLIGLTIAYVKHNNVSAIAGAVSWFRR